MTSRTLASFIGVAAAALSACAFGGLYSSPTFSQVERLIAAQRVRNGETDVPVPSSTLYSSPTFEQVERLITTVNEGPVGPDAVQVTNVAEAVVAADVAEWALAGNEKPDSSSMDGIRATRLGPYFWAMNTDYEDFAKATNRMSRVFPSYTPGCSGLCNNRFHGRNLDWYFDTNATVVIRSPARQYEFDGAVLDKHAVIGVCGGAMSDSFLASGKYDEVYESLPFSISDGMNDSGVVIQQNVITKNTAKSAAWTNSTGRVICFCIIRYALDRCSTAYEAANMINEKVFVPSEFGYDFHYLVSDKTESYIVEDGQVKKTQYTNALTNFRVLGDYNAAETGTVEYNTVSYFDQYGMGLERYTAMRDTTYDTTTAEGMLETMKSVWYTKAYAFDTTWLTEHCSSETGLNVFTVVADPGRFTDEIVEWHNKYTDEHDTASASYRGGWSWQTVHTSVYDKDDLTLTLVTQEDMSSLRKFDLNENVPSEPSALLTDLDAYATTNAVQAISNTVYNTGAYFTVGADGLDLVKDNSVVFSSEYELANTNAESVITLYSGRTTFVNVIGAYTNLTVDLRFPANASKSGDASLRISSDTPGIIGELRLNGETEACVLKGCAYDEWEFDVGDHIYGFTKTAVTNGVTEIWVTHSKSER